jgi:UDP-glucose:(heptosyl)LPS alpha-1,3-glucosyltransferase
MPFRSVVIVRSSFSIHGGAEKIALDVIQALLRNQIDVRLLTWPDQNWPIAHPRLKIIPSGTAKGPRLMQAMSFNMAIEKYLKTNNPECIFSYDKVTTFTHLHAGGGTHRTFLQIKNAESSGLAVSFRRLSLFHRYTLYLEKKGFQNSKLKKIQCPSSLVKKDIVKDYGVPEEKLEVIPNAVDWHKIGQVFDQRQTMAAELIRHHQLDAQRAYLLFLGSGFDRKGLDIAIRGVAGMPDQYGLLVVGKGNTAPYRQMSRELSLKDRILFLNTQENGWKYAALCKALVLPSRYEPFGIAPAEANAMGLPVLVSDKTGYMDHVEEGKNGVILQFPATQEAIADAFTRLLKAIESPIMDAGQIREKAFRLDNSVLTDRLLHHFLGLGG